MFRKSLIIFLSFLTVTLSAQTLSDSAYISLLTCTPGNYVYSQYGHSALRVVDPAHNLDITFNYGIFSFDTENFYLKFIKGETDYQLGIDDTQSFLWGSQYIGRTTYEQILNLTKEQRQSIFDALVENYRPANRFYRYNFVFDNCATRPYVLLKNNVTLKAQSAKHKAQTTYRSLISHYSKANEWVDFGVNIIFGKEADQVMTTEQRLFLPEELMQYVTEATLEDGTPLTDTKAEDIPPFAIGTTPWYLSPYLLVALLCALLILSTYCDLRHKRITWWIDAAFFFLFGILGCIAFFLTFCSLHPLVGENYNLLFCSPIMLIPCLLITFKKGRECLLKSGLIISIYFYAALIVRLCCGQAWHWILILSIIHYLRIRLVWYREIFILGQKKKNKSPIRLLLIALVAIINYQLSIAQAQPRLTVAICVNGLNEKAIDDLRNFLPEGGLRLLDEEAHESNINFPQLVYGGAESLATICTGTTPNKHGIAADNYFNRTDRKIHPIFEDKNVSGIGTDKTLSPTAVLAPTFADEFRMLNPSEHSKIYAVGITPANTLLLAGHAANACAWIEPTTLQWATTTYYPEGLPAAADEMNVAGRNTILATAPWESKMDMNMYLHPSEQEKKQKKYHYNVAEVFCQSPAANTAVVELALAIQQKQNLGKDPQADLLALELNVISPKAQADLLRSAEQEDLYLRLNQDLGFLIEQLTKRVGKEHLRIILFGKPVLGKGEKALEKANLTTNYFNVDRAAALINTYLMVLYGHERWIDGGYLNSIYLNRTLIEQKRIPLAEMQQQVSNFLLEFEGTEQAFPAYPNPIFAEKLAQSINKKCTGEVVFTLQPLWLIGENSKKRQTNILEQNPTAPLFIWTTERLQPLSNNINATNIKTTILQ